LRFVVRWLANGLAFYLGLYLVDSLIAPWFYIRKGWIAIVLAILLGCANSLVHPFPRFKAKRNRSLGFFALTVLGNFFFMQIIIWLGAPLSAPNPIAVMFTALFLTLLAALMNHVVGFKPKEQSKVVTRGLGVTATARERERQKGRPRPRR
jgi:steroid 5-alpha reductase family enzyme